MGSNNKPRVILRRPQVQARTGYSRSTIYQQIADGLWPHPVAMGARAVGWPESEVEAMNAARIAGRAEEDIRELVQKLEASRVLQSTN